MVFQNRKSTREGKNDKSDNFEMDIIYEGALNTALEVPAKIKMKGTWKKIYEVVDNECLK